MKRESPSTHQSHSPSPRSAKQISDALATWDLGPLSQHHCIGHVADEDLSIPERSPRNKRIRRKICRNVQFAESYGTALAS